MALNGLAGAGQSKTQILEAKGIFEEKATGQVQLLGGIFNRKKSGSGSSTPTTKKSPADNGDLTSPVSGTGGGRDEKMKLEEAMRRQEKESGKDNRMVVNEPEKKAITA
jgi:hypothetical protein